MSRGLVSRYKIAALTAARDFHYTKEEIARIKEAKTDNDVARVMITIRKEREEK